jgi:hypothetical protein
MRWLGLLAVLAVSGVLGCAGGGTTITLDVPVDRSDVATETAIGDTAPDPGISDVPADLIQQETDGVLPDFGTDAGLACQPGEGCFGDKCEDGKQCDSGWCADHLGEGVCTMACQEECPAGWECKQVSGLGPDVVFLCVSKHANLCRPCAVGADCKSLAGVEDVCVDYGTAGSFCGGVCAVDDDCPWGFSCVDGKTVEGVDTRQCVADSGVCPCTAKSVALALSTPCEVTNEAGTCTGKRLCMAEGLTECDAAVPAEETCNGVDDDCDGDVDEPAEVDGDLVNLCDDGNECSKDMCKGAEGCSYEMLGEGECKDGDACTVGDHCEAGVCVGNPVLCDDSNPCTDDSCDGLGGCKFQANSAGCDDGDPCTVADSCKNQVCGGVAVSCDCQADEDCAALEDGDLCNGTLVCAKGKFPYLCVVKAGSEVECPPPAAGPGAACQEASCDGVTGKCGIVPAHEGFACDDGNLCTVGEACAEGKCQGGVGPNCSDDNPCTDDLCVPGEGCLNIPNASACNDGNACTGQDVCSGGKCVGGPALVCDDGSVCSGQETCDPVKGCMAGVALVCNDGNVCNGQETCDPKLGCKAGTALVCDDANVCTSDSCDPAKGCAFAAKDGACDDGNACTLGDVCKSGKCSPGLAKDCGDGNVCTDNSCDPVLGCVTTMNQAPCDDGSLCTTGDHCHLGGCISSGKLECNDGNLCTDDACDAKVGCQFKPNTLACDDGSVCTDVDVCAAGWCKPGKAVTCDDGNTCTDDVCDPVSGCKHAANQATCTDGDACTVGDVCNGGKCVPGAAAVCDDGNMCTKDSCHKLLGCVYDALGGSCNDGNACTDGDSCVNAVCVPGPALPCNDGNGCTDDSCEPKSGCVFQPNQAGCDDGNSCTSGEKCSGGTCQGGAPVSCDDGNSCTTDSCNPATGCAHAPMADGEVCAPNKVCFGGVCAACGDLHGQSTFQYTGSAQTFTVPQCIYSVAIDLYAAEGGIGTKGTGGKGGRLQATLPVSPGATLSIHVGGKGADGNGAGGGWNGGGSGASGSGCYGGGGGGGGTDIRVGGAALSNRVAAAGGGGGGGADGCTCNALWGGGGGGPIGASGQGGAGCAGGCEGSGTGGTQTAGGTAGKWACSSCNSTDGALGQGGNGDTAMTCGSTTGGGGGGGGYYGGGGGGLGAGGGGSSYAAPTLTNVAHSQGVRSGNGMVTITW